MGKHGLLGAGWVVPGRDIKEKSRAGKVSWCHIVEALGCPKALHFLSRQQGAFKEEPM